MNIEQEARQRRATLKKTRAFLVRMLVCGALIGAAMAWLGERETMVWGVGQVLVVCCVVPLMPLFGAQLRKNAGVKDWLQPPSPQAEFAVGVPVPELLVTMRLLSAAQGGRAVALRDGRHSFALALGSEGYTVRFELPGGAVLDAENEQRVAVQFLNPALALPRFLPGTAFRMLTRNGVIGEGVVLERVRTGAPA